MVQDAVEAGFDFNGVKNGIGLDKFTKAAGEGVHANHPNYTKQLEQKITEWANQNKNFTPDQAKKYLEGFVDKVKNQIQKESVEGGKKVNDLIIK